MKNSKIRTAVCGSVILILFVSFSLLILSISIPNKALIGKGENAESLLPDNCKWIMSVKSGQSKEVTRSTLIHSDSDEPQSYDATVYFCGLIPVKTVSVSVSDNVTVVPGGRSIGINLKIRGVLVTEHAPFTDENGNDASPAEKAGIRVGDTIEKINGSEIDGIEAASKAIVESNGKLIIEGKRIDTPMTWEVTPLPDFEGIPRLGLKIREGVSGIGTLTYYCDGGFAALGHPISDIDTGIKVDIESGSVYPASIIGIDKGEKGEPGSLKGIFSGEKQGSVTANTECGIFGTAPEPAAPKVNIAKTKEIHTGKAIILCDIGDGVKEYSARILRVMPGADDTKGMVVEITDNRLISRTGGIVQGMSGSPILQNGKLVGAVTHVLVNDPTRGYGIFIENMLSEAEKIK